MEMDLPVRSFRLLQSLETKLTRCVLAGINSRYSSQFSTSILAGATWDRELWDYRADIMSKEYQAAGIHVPLSIVAGPVGRSAYGGRKFVFFIASFRRTSD
jgi:hypothetical protein